MPRSGPLLTEQQRKTIEPRKKRLERVFRSTGTDSGTRWDNPIMKMRRMGSRGGNECTFGISGSLR